MAGLYYLQQFFLRKSERIKSKMGLIRFMLLTVFMLTAFYFKAFKK